MTYSTSQDPLPDSILLRGVQIKQAGYPDSALQWWLTHTTHPNDADLSDSTRAQIHHQIALIYYKMALRKDAIDQWQTANRLRLNYSSPLDEDIIKTWINIGQSYLSIEEYDQARRFYQKALQSLDRLEVRNEHQESRVYQALGRLETYLQNYTPAIEYLQRSFDLKQGKSRYSPIHMNNVCLDIIALYAAQYDGDSMLRWININRSYIDQIEDQAARSRLMADWHSNRGVAYFYINRVSEAIGEAEASLENNHTHPDRALYVAINRSNLAEYYLSLGRFDEGIDQVLQAIEYFRSDPAQDPYHAVSLDLLGQMYGATRQLEKAIDCFDQVIDMRTVAHGVRHLPIGQTTMLMDAYYHKAGVLYDSWTSDGDTSNLRLAHRAFHQLAETIHMQISHIGHRQSQLYLARRGRSYYSLGMKISYDLFHLDQSSLIPRLGLEYMEASKAISLTEALRQKARYRLASTHTAAYEKEVGYRKRLAEYELQAKMASNAEIIDEWKDSIIAMHNLLMEIGRSVPAADDRSSTSNLDDMIETYLSVDGPSLLNYYVADDRIYRITRGSVGWMFDTLIDRSLVLDQVSNYVSMLQDHRSSCDDIRDTGHNLYRHLVSEDIARQLGDRVLVIPDHLISFVPFSALIRTSQPTCTYQELDYWLRHVDISYASSLTSYAMQHQSNKSHQRSRPLVMATSYHGVDTALQQIYASYGEGRTVHELIRGDLYLEEDARKVVFDRYATQASVIHLSLHGRIDRDDPALSHLIFHPDGDSSGGDHHLYAHEIYTMEIPAQLVVLSACQSGAGQIANGEGVLSLAHAFAYAGARSTICSQWQVSSSATRQLLTGFYRHMSGDSGDAAGALSMTKEAYIDQIIAPEQAHPYYWAPLIYYGQRESVLGLHHPSRASRYLWIIVGLVSAVIAVAIWRQPWWHRDDHFDG